MPTIYLSYRQPNEFVRLADDIVDDTTAINYGRLRNYTIIKVADYVDGSPESGTMSILFRLNERGGTSGSSSRESSGTPPPENALDAAHLVPSANSGIASPTKEEEEDVRRYNLNIFNVLEFTNIYKASQDASRKYYSQKLDIIIRELDSKDLGTVVDKESHETAITLFNRTFENIIYFIKMLNNIFYIGVDRDIPDIVGFLSRLYADLDRFEESMTIFMDSRLGFTAFDKVVFQLKIAVAYYMANDYLKAEKIFKTISLAEVEDTSLVYVLVKYYYALTEQNALDFIKSNALLEEALQGNKQLKEKIPNMYLRCKLVQADNYLFLNDPKALEIHKELSTMTFSPINPSGPKPPIPEEEQAYKIMPKIMDNLVKSRYATVKYYIGDVKPTLNELQQIVNTFRKYLPAFHPFTIDAQFILYFIEFSSLKGNAEREVNKTAMIRLLQTLTVMKGVMYPMIFLYYSTMYSMLELTNHTKIKTVYLKLIQQYTNSFFSELPDVLREEDKQELVNAIRGARDEIPTYFTNDQIALEGEIEYLTNLPYLCITNLCKETIMELAIPHNRDDMFREALFYFRTVPGQRESFKIAVRTSIDTTGLIGNDIHLFRGALYEAAAKSLAPITNNNPLTIDTTSPTIDKELLVMAREEYLKVDTMQPANVQNLHDAGFVVEDGTSVDAGFVVEDGTSVVVSLVTKRKGVFGTEPDYMSIKITKDNKANYYRLKVGSKFKLPRHTDILTVTSIVDKGIQYSMENTDRIGTLFIPAEYNNDPDIKQAIEKDWIFLSQGLVPESAPKRGGTRSKKGTPLEKKTRKVRNNLSVKMEE